MLNTPILFLVFNRLDTTQQVFAKIREAQPRQLFIGSDGARVGKEGEADKVEAVRKYILDNIDWDCEVKTLFREQNLGCGVAPAEAITWFFENVEQGIILEDDCLPDASFFTFCEELLDYYKDNEQIMHIGGTNDQFGHLRSKGSYYFSIYPHIWGWATWRRAWENYSFKLKNVTLENLETIFKNFQFTPTEKKFWINTFQRVENGDKKDIWDFQWVISVWLKNGLTIVPNTNLIKNIGFDDNATHTNNTKSRFSNMETASIGNIIHTEIKSSRKADKYSFDINFGQTNFLQSFKSMIVRVTPKFIRKIIKSIIKKNINISISSFFMYFRVLKYKILSTNSVSGRKPKTFQPLLLKGKGKINIDPSVHIGIIDSPNFYNSYAYIEARNEEATIDIAKGVYINNNVVLISVNGGIKIGENCLIGYNVEILDNDFHHINPMRRMDGVPQSKPICIEENVFIGSNVSILKGVTIGKNSIIANKSVVTQHIPANSIAAGNPAKVIKHIEC